MKFTLLVLAFSLTLNALHAQNCKSIPKIYRSYSQAISVIDKAKFGLVDEINTSKSSWIRSATFKSCDGKTGFLIIGTDLHPYIHQNVPISLWKSFKRAGSFGSFYSKQIRNKYKILSFHE